MMIETLNVSLDRPDLLCEQIHEPVYADDVENWLLVEEDIEVSRKIVEDALVFEIYQIVRHLLSMWTIMMTTVTL